MSKTTKAIAASAALVGAAGAGLCALVYEAALNIRLANWFGTKLNFRDPVQDALNQNEYRTGAAHWWEEQDKHEEIIEDKNGNTLHSMIINAQEPSSKWAVIVHGFTSGPDGMAHYAMEYHKRGYNCLLPALRGHSLDTNHYCSMGWYDKDMVVNWINWIVLQDPDAQVVIHGESMGAATTMLTTGETLPSNVKAAVSDCGYTNVMKQYESVLRSKNVPPQPLLTFLNMYSNMKGNFDFNKCSPIDAVARSVTPTLFVHGDADDFVPYSMLQENFDACSAPKEKFFVHGAVHASSANYAPEFYWENVDNFLVKYIK